MEGSNGLRAWRRALALSALALGLLPAANAHAVAGLPDSSFGAGGFTILDEPSAINEVFEDVTVLKDGKLLAVGRPGGSTGFLAARFNANGTPDGGFGSGGIQIQPDTGMVGDPRSISDLTIDADGAIVVAGLGRGAGGFNAFGFSRLHPDGSPDGSFGDGGVKVVDVPGLGGAGGVGVAPNGSIIGVGTAGNEIGLVRLTTAGQPDPGFGVAGVKTLDIPGSASEFAQSVEVLADGSILVGGLRDDGGFLAKLDPAGNPIAAFGSGGFVSHPFATSAVAFADVNDIRVRPNGSILAVGSSALVGNDSQLFAARFTSSGAFDPAFATGGLFVSNPTPVEDGAQALQLVENRILVAGFRGDDDGLDTGEVWLLRLTGAGVLDPTFGQGGQSIPSGITNREAANGLALQPDGKAVIAGRATPALGFQLLIGRFTADTRCKGKLPTAVGTAAADTIVGTGGVDVIVSLGGNDRVNTGDGKDLVCAGRGKDRVTAGKGKDHVFGEAGNDRAGGGPGRDNLEGGRGRDMLAGSRGRDTLLGNAGRDRLFGGGANDRLRGGKGKRDRCNGGKGKRDRATGCESKKRIP